MGVNNVGVIKRTIEQYANNSGIAALALDMAGFSRGKLL